MDSLPIDLRIINATSRPPYFKFKGHPRSQEMLERPRMAFDDVSLEVQAVARRMCQIPHEGFDPGRRPA